jgi:CubicO group peptidase (beta-lactamase class C family)
MDRALKGRTMHAMRWMSHLIIVPICLAVSAAASPSASAGESGMKGRTPPAGAARVPGDMDDDGLPDGEDDCMAVQYDPGFDWDGCGVMNLDPADDDAPECKARERIAHLLLNDPRFITNIAFSVVKHGEVHFADAFEYLGGGAWAHDPEGVHRLYRIGSTSKSVVATAAKIMEEQGALSLDDFVNDEDGTQLLAGGQRTLRDLLSHRGAFKLDNGALHLFCYDGDLADFWADPDDLVSPQYDSAVYGNLGGGFEYSAFNYSLAGAHLAHRAGTTFEQVVQTRVFDVAGMCTATLDGSRAVTTPIGSEGGFSQGGSMHVGPYINQESLTDPRIVDNYYSSEDLPGDAYTWQYYNLDEAAAEARDPAGGVIASVIDMAHFASALLKSYHGTGGLLSQAGVRELWGATSDLDCAPGCPYAAYYGIGFFTEHPPGEPIIEVGHGGSRAGYASAFVLRPEANMAVCILANADVSTVALSDLAKIMLDEFEAAMAPCPGDVNRDGAVGLGDLNALLSNWGACPAPPAGCPWDMNAPPDGTVGLGDLNVLLSTWGPCPE